jgi:hypothetical protein
MPEPAATLGPPAHIHGGLVALTPPRQHQHDDASNQVTVQALLAVCTTAQPVPMVAGWLLCRQELAFTCRQRR